MDYIKVKGLQKDEVKGLVKEWIKLYPHSFNSEVNFWFYELADNQVVIAYREPQMVEVRQDMTIERIR